MNRPSDAQQGGARSNTAQRARAIADAHRAHDASSAGAVILIWGDAVYGWKNCLRDPRHERPGAIAVDPAGRVFQARGGNDQDGAREWSEVSDPRQGADGVDVLAHALACLSKATPGLLETDSVKNEGSYGDGGPDCRNGFLSYALVREDGKTIADTLNSDVAMVHEDSDDDYLTAWDEVGSNNMAALAACWNFLRTHGTAVAELIATADLARRALSCDARTPSRRELAWLLDLPFDATIAAIREAACERLTVATLRAKGDAAKLAARESNSAALAACGVKS